MYICTARKFKAYNFLPLLVQVLVRQTPIYRLPMVEIQPKKVYENCVNELKNLLQTPFIGILHRKFYHFTRQQLFLALKQVKI